MRVDTFHAARMLAERPCPEDVVAFTLTTHRASRRVMEKVGMRYERDLTHAGLPHVLFRLTAGEWRRGPVRERFPLLWR